MLNNLLSGLNPDIEWIKERTIYLTRHGSHAYGTNIESSDEDFRGVAIPPKSYFTGFLKHFDNLVRNDPDVTIFDIKKFFLLALENNPNVLEILFVDPSDIILITPLGEKLLSVREKFISRASKERFLGYAKSQLHRIKSHKRWLMEAPEAPPTRAECGLPEEMTIPKDQLLAVESQLRKTLDSWRPDFEPFSEPQQIYLQTKVRRTLAEMGVTADNEWMCAARKLGYNDNFIRLLQKEKEFQSKRKDWENYQKWKKERNEVRAALEAKFGFDCYSDDTEFLTNDGWKKFDNISNDDKLATVYVGNSNLGNKNPKYRMTHKKLMGIEYQNYTNKFDSIYNGPMYHLYGTHMDVLVTANHRMLFRKVERKSKYKFNWCLNEAAALPDTFDVLVAPEPKIKNYCNKYNFPIKNVAYLSLMGWYLSDGCMRFKKAKPSSIAINQKVGGKLCALISRWQNKYGAESNSSVYVYDRKPNEFRPYEIQEKILNIRNKTIVNNFYNECGVKADKRIPRWVFSLSKRLMECLLFALIKGDGTVRNKTSKKSFIYYSKSKKLADDVQELALLCGWESSLWGPYKSNHKKYSIQMYQVHLRKTYKNYKTLMKNSNVKRIEVNNQRIVCFTVPNGTLITRRNGKIAIHGNCKHGMHLIRLLRMAKEMLIHGKVIVRRPDAEELKSIRNGAWSYEQLVEHAEAIEKEVEEAYYTSPLSERPDRIWLDGFCQGLIEKSFENCF